MRIFWLAFLGKLAASFFIAFCAAIGFGPSELVKMVMPASSSETVLLIARVVFLLAAAAAIAAWVWFAFFRSRRQKPPQGLTIATLDNSALKLAAITHAAKMRTFESRADQKREEWSSMWPPKHNTSEEESRRLFDEYNRRTLADYDARTLEFNNSYLPTARELLAEMEIRLRREGIFPPYGDTQEVKFGGVVFRNAPLAGPYPIRRAADYLEHVARLLPAS